MTEVRIRKNNGNYGKNGDSSFRHVPAAKGPRTIRHSYTEAQCFKGKTIEEARKIRKDFTNKMMEGNKLLKENCGVMPSFA